MLGDSGQDMDRELGSRRIIATDEVHLAIINVAMNARLRDNRSSFAMTNRAFAFPWLSFARLYYFCAPGIKRGTITMSEQWAIYSAACSVADQS
jgi:hypothetical protein